jgi:two-component system sensor histidine kinase VanS
MRERRVDRAPGLSVRLKLTLSYAGFIMLAGALLLAVVWVFLLRYVPERAVLLGPGPLVPTRSDLLRAFTPKAAMMLAFLLVFGLVGGIGGEPLLFGDVCFEPREHGVEAVGEFAELIVAAR